VKVFGNGSDDAVCIRLRGKDYFNNGVFDFVVRLDFTGWKEFILGEPDNVEFSDLVFPGKEDGLWEFYREGVSYESLDSVEIYLSGDCDGVRMSSIEAVRHINRPLVNPTASVNGKQITFGCTVESSEYLEYTPDEGALIYDRYGNSRSVESIEGELVVPKGEFTAVLTDSSDALAPGRATLTFGVYGKTIS
jgi:hypothetical protein